MGGGGWKGLQMGGGAEWTAARNGRGKRNPKLKSSTKKTFTAEVGYRGAPEVRQYPRAGLDYSQHSILIRPTCEAQVEHSGNRLASY